MADDCETLAQTSDLINGGAEKAIAPTPNQWQAERAKLAELLQALHDAQSNIERLTAENFKLHEVNSDLLRRGCPSLK